MLSEQERRIVEFGRDNNQTKEQIMEALQRSRGVTFGTTVGIQPIQPTEPAQKVGFLSALKTRFEERRERGIARRERLRIGEQKIPETIFQEAGEVLGGAFDIAIEGIKALTPDKAKQVIKERASELFPDFKESPIGKLLGLGVEKFEELSPRAQDNVRATMELVILAPVTKIAQVGVRGITEVAEVTGRAIAPIFEKVTQKGVAVVEKRLAKQITGEALEVTRVKVGELTLTQKKELIAKGGTETQTALLGLSRKEKIIVTDRDRAIANSVADVVSLRGASQNVRAIKDKIARISEDIDVGLKGNNTIYNKVQIRSNLNKSREESISIFQRDKTLVGQYDDVTDFFLKILEKHPKNNAGLLVARKEFDTEFKKRFPNVFTKFDSTDSGRFTAFMNIRRNVNDIIADSLPEGNIFKAQLKEQNKMFDAIDNIALKGAKQIETGLIERSLAAIDNHGIRTLLISGSLLGLSAFTSGPVVISLLAGAVSIKIGKKIFKAKIIKEAIIKALRQVERESRILSKLELEEITKTIAILGGVVFLNSAIQLPSKKEIKQESKD